MMIRHTTWRLLNSNTATAEWNMAVDEALLSGFKEGDMPILRLYGWENALSLGRFSTFFKSLHQENIQAENVPCVRRMSGGGILVHGGDLSYSLIIPRDWLRGKGVKEGYHYLCGFLISLYKKLGHKAQFACDLQWDEIRSDICLAGTQAYDIVIEGKKMGGNAQRHTRHALFQHGSIPIRIDDSFFKPLFLEEAGLD
ncbi:MAG: lipoate--protein ligase family protein, partial [Sulfuricurvum sp.]|nr:lipoate--protein ligase family protein [Sulfuricurvum sp.]